MPKPSTAAERIQTRYPAVWQAFSNLAQACHNTGPLDEKARRLVKLAIAVEWAPRAERTPLCGTPAKPGLRRKKWNISCCFRSPRLVFQPLDAPLP